MGFFSWIIIGGLAGWIASKIMGTDAQMGTFLNIIVGVLGGFIGGFLMDFFFDKSGMTGFNFSSFFVALVGSVILLWVVKKIRS